MSRAKAMSDWDHTSAMRADIQNAAFGRKKIVASLGLHPLRKQNAPTKTLGKKAGARLLDSVFGTGE